MTGQQHAKSLGSSCWPTKTLADCIEKVKVPAKIPRTSFLEEGNLPIISQEADFINGYWNDEADLVRVVEPLVVFGDHTQVLKLIDFDFVVGADGVKVLKPKQFLDAKFLRFYLEANPFPSLGYARHYRHISTLEVPLPPLDEQKRIVAVLDQTFAALDRARAHAEANLADAEALFVRLAYDNLRKVAETGKFAPVGEISDHCLGKMLDRSKNKGTFRPYLRNINVRWFEVDTSDILEMRIEDRELDRYEVRKGDLLICEGGYPGRASIYEGDARTYFQKALHRVRFSDESLAKVLMYWLFVEDKLGKLKDCFSGTGISHFTGKTLASYLMPMSDPPTNARAVENIDRHLAWTNSVISGYRQKLTDLANLRQSLLQKAFSGELT